MAKSLSYREAIKRLHRENPNIIVSTRQGKGSHRMLSLTDSEGVKRSIPITCHGSKDVSPGVLKSILRRFDLPRNLFD